jgi:hypothetical protein
MVTLQTLRQCAHMLHSLQYLVHVEEGSQPTPPWEWLHHTFTHDLRNQRYLNDRQIVVYVAYIADNKARCVGIRVSVIAKIVHGANA